MFEFLPNELEKAFDVNKQSQLHRPVLPMNFLRWVIQMSEKLCLVLLLQWKSSYFFALHVCYNHRNDIP